MGAGCSSSLGKTVEPQPATDCPSRPAYLACDLVAPSAIEKVRLGPVDTLLGQAAQFADATASLNDTLNCVLADLRTATGLLQGGFSVQLLPSPNVDIFSFELLTAEGRPLEMAEAARLRGRDLIRGGKLAALDAKLAQCLEDLADSFIRNVGITNSSLALSSSGTLVPRTAGQPLDPVVEEFNRTMSSMRSALGSDYLLALHLHKAQAHGMPAFRVRLLKPALEASQPGPDPQTPRKAAPAGPPAGTIASVAAAAATACPSGGSPPPPPGFHLATLLDQASCLNASRLADCLHAFQDANGRLAAALKKTGLKSQHAIVPITPRSVALAGTPAAAAATLASPSPTLHPQPSSRRSRKSASASTFKPDPAAAAASAVRCLAASSRLLVARAVEGLNGAVHSLAHAAAAAPGHASFAALLTHVLGELRDVVAAVGGDRALETYQPAVHFVGGPDQAPALDFRLDPQLTLQGQGQGQEWTRALPPFPDCLSPPVRRAWLLLVELLRVHNSVVGQLESLRQLATGFEEALRRRSDTLSQDAAAARMALVQSADAAQALLRNHVELRDCWQGSLHVLAATALLVRDEMAEAAQLARVQCSFMSPMAWSVSIASSPAIASPGGGATTTGSLSSSMALSTTTTTAASVASGSAHGSSNTQPAATGAGGGSSPVWSPSSRSLAAGTSVRSRGVVKNLASSFAAAADTVAEDAGGPPLPFSPPDVRFLQDQQQQQRSAQSTPIAAAGMWPTLSRLAADNGGDGAAAAGMSLSRASSRTAGSAAGMASRTIHRTINTSTRSNGSRDSAAGWMPVDGAAAAAGGGPMGLSFSPATPQRPVAQSPAPATVPAAMGNPAVGRRSGGESLADEYARTALAHLRLQDL